MVPIRRNHNHHRPSCIPFLKTRRRETVCCFWLYVEMSLQFAEEGHGEQMFMVFMIETKTQQIVHVMPFGTYQTFFITRLTNRNGNSTEFGSGKNDHED